MNTKNCINCGEEFEDWPLRKCRVCYNSERNAKTRERRLTDPDFAERCRNRGRKYIAADPERNRKHGRDYYARNADRLRIKMRETVRRNQEWYLVRNAKRRAKENNLPFDLSPDDISVPIDCPVLGIPLFKGEGSSCENSPTLDRIVPSLGYVRGNVAVMSQRANRLKNDATVEEVQKVCDWLKANTPKEI